MRETTPFASILPLNGYIMVLALRHRRRADFREQPAEQAAVRGQRRPRPVAPDPRRRSVHRPSEEGWRVDRLPPQPNAGHNTAWWPEIKDSFEAFVHDHPRQPLPDTLTWEMGNERRVRSRALAGDRSARRAEERRQERWRISTTCRCRRRPTSGSAACGMRINRVVEGSNAARMGLKAGDVLLRLNDRSVAAASDVADALSDEPPGSKIALMVVRDNLPVELEGIYQPQTSPRRRPGICSRGGGSGRVDLARAGNVITATTRGVAAFTLLLSPDQFDFVKPVKVIANGRTVFDGKVEKSVDAAQMPASDNDRTMLFGAELHIKLD
jgi:hypothetical protein